MNCEVCGTEFEPRKPNQKVCSAKCRKEKWKSTHPQAGKGGAPALLLEVDGSKPRRGKPVKLTLFVQKSVCDAIRSGAYATVACRKAGISVDSLARYRVRGEKGEEPFCTFLEALEQAEVDREVALGKIIVDAAKEDWRAAAHLLERIHPDRWARRAVEGMQPDMGGGFRIILNLGEPEGPRVIQLGPPIPTVGEDVARAIELDSPATKA
jgi:hypothetical protein